jgi:hypothetical protein
MKKKERSLVKPQASPNPRPKTQNKKQRDSMVNSKKRDNSPDRLPIQTPTHTPECPTVGNSFEALQNESEEEDGKSVDIVSADDPQIKIKSKHSGETEPTTVNTHLEHMVSAKTPDKEKQRLTSSGPITQIPPMDNEHLGTSILPYTLWSTRGAPGFRLGCFDLLFFFLLSLCLIVEEARRRL